MDIEKKNPVPIWSASQVILATLFVVAVGFGFWLVYRYRMIVLLLFAAIFLGTALQPAVNWNIRRGLSRGASIAVVYLILLAALAVMLLTIAPLLIRQSFQLVSSLPEMYIDLRSALITTSSAFLQNIALNMPPDLQRIFNVPSLENESIDTVTRFLTISGSTLYGIAAALAVIVLTTYWILESERAIRTLLLLTPQRNRQQTRDLIEAVEQRVGAFLRGQLILCISVGVLAFAVYLIIGLPNALALALFAGVFEAVPIFGPTLGAIPAGLVAISIDPAMVLWVVLATIVIQVLENFLLVPRIMDVSVGVHPIIVLLSLVTFTSLFGIAGALLAIPLASIFQMLLERFVFTSDQKNLSEAPGRNKQSALHYEIRDLIGDIRKQLRKKGERSDPTVEEVEDAIETLAVELDSMMEQDDHE